MGFISAAMRPTLSWASFSSLLAFAKRSASASSRPKARTTRTPVRFSRVAEVTASSFCCTRLYIGEVSFITPKTITASTGMAMTKMLAAPQSMVKAITIAPMTMNGLRRNRRRNMFTPFCTWLTSAVMRVMRVETPMVSSSVKESFWMWAISSWRRPVDVPMAARAAKYCAVKEQPRPMSAIRISRPHWPRIYPLSRVGMPVLMMLATISGTSRSNMASSILNRGAMMLSNRYFFMYGKRCFMPFPPHR